MKKLDAKEFGLSSRVQLIKTGKDRIAIVKKRKSRIIMKDGKQIMEIARAIKKQKPQVQIELIVSGPICSKTTRYLQEHGITIVHE
jgi:predicted Fe-Mo cluster-binding NifX family protein